MYPNPQAALPLPSRPNLEQYKKQAKDLVKACRSGDPDLIDDWAAAWVDDPRVLGELQEFARRRLAEKHALADAQFVIARAHGFTSWAKFARHIESVTRSSSAVSNFESAADAIVAGDANTLERLLGEHPGLARARSTREHRATLLHYVSANGVEGYRQKIPRNIVRITGLLLESGADVNAEADVYGGGCTTLLLAATSVHPERAGVQLALLDFLLEHGARIGEDDVMHCLANGRAAAAEFLANRGGRLNFEAAAGVGRLEIVEKLLPKATPKEVTAAFLCACECGRNSVVEYLLDNGIDIAAHGSDGQTALHRAAMGRQLSTIKLLLKRGAPLEVRNAYNGTVLGQTVWSAAHGGDPDVYIPIIETLIAAGAKLGDRHPPVSLRVDEILARHGSRSDPTLSWFGEKPISGRRSRAGRAKS